MVFVHLETNLFFYNFFFYFLKKKKFENALLVSLALWVFPVTGTAE